MNSKSIVSLFAISAGLGLALLSGCATASPTIASQGDPAAAYANYHSYMMLNPAGLAPGRNPAITPVLVRQMREEAGKAFAAKGLTKSPDGFADVMILIHGGLQDKIEVQEFGLRYGRFGPGAQSVDSYKEGSLYVDVFDGKTRELVWRGSAVAEVNGVPDAAQLTAALNTIIARYPN